MKIITLAAGLALAAGIGASADAQTVTTTRTVTRTHTETGPVRHGAHRVCTVTYHHHAKVRRCRTERY